VIKLFSQDGKLLNDHRTEGGRGHQQGKRRCRCAERHRNTVSGPAVTYQVNPTVAARAGFTPEEVAIDAAAVLEGRTGGDSGGAERSGIYNSCSLPRPEPVLARQYEQYIANQRYGTNGDAWFPGASNQRSGRNGNSSRESAASGPGDGAVGRSGHGKRCRRGAKSGE